MPTFIDERTGNTEAIARPAEPEPAKLTQYMQTISKLLPDTFSMAALEKNYAVMNHAGNSQAADVADGNSRGYTDRDPGDPKSAEEQDLYDGGKCAYDPYFLYGFSKFGEDLFDQHDTYDDYWGAVEDTGFEDPQATLASRDLSSYDQDFSQYGFEND